MSIALLLGQDWATLTSDESSFKSALMILHQNLEKYQVYSLAFRPRLAKFSHFSIITQNLVKLILHQNWGKYQV